MRGNISFPNMIEYLTPAVGKEHAEYIYSLLKKKQISKNERKKEK